MCALLIRLTYIYHVRESGVTPQDTGAEGGRLRAEGLRRRRDGGGVAVVGGPRGGE